MGLAQAEQRRGGDGRIVETHDPREMLAGIGEVPGREQIATALEQGQGDVTGQLSALSGVRPAIRGTRLAHARTLHERPSIGAVDRPVREATHSARPRMTIGGVVPNATRNYRPG